MTETQTKSKREQERDRKLGEIIIPEHERKVRDAQNAADEVGIQLAHDRYNEAREQELSDRERVEKELEKRRKEEEEGQ